MGNESQRAVDPDGCYKLDGNERHRHAVLPGNETEQQGVHIQKVAVTKIELIKENARVTCSECFHWFGCGFQGWCKHPAHVSPPGNYELRLNWEYCTDHETWPPKHHNSHDKHSQPKFRTCMTQ